MNDKEKEDRVTQLFENITLPRKRRNNKKPKDWRHKLSFNQWLLIALIIINLTVLILHVYNTFHVREILMYQQIEDETLKHKGDHNAPSISP